MGSSTEASSPGSVARLVSATKVFGTDDAAVTALDDVSVDFLRAQFTSVMGGIGDGDGVADATQHLGLAESALDLLQLFVRPSSTNRRTLGAPIPLPPPVTMATCRC